MPDDPNPQLFSPEIRSKLRKLLELYFDTVVKRVQREHVVSFCLPAAPRAGTAQSRGLHPFR